MSESGIPEELGLDASWRIVLPDSPSSAEEIAAAELKEFLGRMSLALDVRRESGSRGPRRLLLGTPGSLRAVGDLVRSGKLKLCGPEDDGFHLRRLSGDVVAAGSNPRSVLYGVYRLIDWLRGDRDGADLDLAEQAHFRERWMCPTLHGRTDDERCFRYLARSGVNTSYLRGRRDAFIEVKHLTHYVADRTQLPGISEAAPPHEELVRMIKGAFRHARRYGMEITMFQDEPVAIPTAASKGKEIGDGLPPAVLDALPPGATGTAYCQRYRVDGWKALSVFHPKVEAHYRELLRQVLARFPGLRTLYVYNEDAGSANVYPPDEPCARDRYPAGYDGYPYAAHLRLVEILQETGRAIDPAFRVATVTYHWYQPDALRRTMAAGLPPGSVLVALGAWDDSVDTSALPAWTEDLCRQARERGGLALIADDDFNGTSDDLLMEITAGFPMPIRTWRKMRAWAKAGAVGITQHHTGGPTFGVNSITDLAWRVFSWHPLMEQEEAERAIAALLVRQLGGEAAAEEMMQACRAVDRALDAVEAAADNRPYSSRLHHSYERFMFPPHLEAGLRREGAPLADYCGDGIDPAVWRGTLAKEVAAYEEALAHARAAAELAPADASPFYLRYDDGRSMSCAEYARIAANAVEIVLGFRRTFLNFLDADASPAGSEADVWRRERDNMAGLLEALEARRRWMQSPYGWRILEWLIGRVRAKRALIDGHLR